MGMPKNLRAVVTGGGSGLGRALCLEVARRGGRVVVSDVDREGAEETATQVRAKGSEAFVVECDVADADAVDALAARAEALLGGVDLLCNNAGVAVGGPFEDIPLEDWRWIVDINLWGVIHGCRAFLPKMKERGSGYIVNVASAAGLLSGPQMSPYNVTKAGVVALSETLHAELARTDVHLSVLCPMFFQTRIAQSARASGPDQERTTALVETLMKRSRLQAPDVARLALDAVEKNHLYAVPMRHGRMLWRLKRLTPRGFHRLMGFAPS